MMCSYPILLYDTKSKKQRLVPCGQCLACRINKTSEWKLRLEYELETWNVASFVTLTYDNEHLPSDNGLHKEDFQRFMKRLRKYSGYDLKYFACGEYGGRFKRPHY